MAKVKKPRVVLVWIDDEKADIYVEIGAQREYVGNVNHDEDAWSGMEKVRKIVTELGKRLGFKVVEEGEPGV